MSQPLTTREIQMICLEMLRATDKLCRAEEIPYFLAGGTLLGAVRHGGFIPWDDDVDLLMPRPAFERFLRLAPKRLPKCYRIEHPRLPDAGAMPWIRIYDRRTRVAHTETRRFERESLFIDIFPVDALPARDGAAKLFFRWIRFKDILLKCSLRTSVADDRRLLALKRALMVLSRVRRPQSYARGIDRTARSLMRRYERARYAGVCVFTRSGIRERMPVEVFRGSVSLPFEDGRFPAPIGYHTYLRGLYGDYMQLPPVEKRVPVHRLDATMLPEEEWP